MSDPHGDLVTYDIKVDGQALPNTYQVISAEIEQSANRIGRARIRLSDGDESQQTFAISSAATFKPGKPVTISLGYDSTNAQVFSGIVTGQRIGLSNGERPFLDVECRDTAVALTIGRKSKAFSKSKDSDAITQLISAAGLTTKVTATSATLDSLIQYDSTDWDFIVSRAEINGMLVLTLNGTVTVFDPLDQAAASATLTYGADLFGFDGALDAVGQLSSVSAIGWDPASLATLSASANASFAGPGNLSSKDLATALSQAEVTLRTAAPETNDGLTGWAKALLAKSALAKIVATASIQGRSDLTPGKTVTLAGLGDRFNGTHLITGVRHQLREGNWTLDLDLGMERHWFVESHEVSSPPAAGLLPGIKGLFSGTVLKIDSDPNNGFRIQVEIAFFNDQGTGVWARMAHFYATDGKGAFFLPEIGDEVLLGFVNEDPRFPVILGSLYSKNRKPDASLTPDADNSNKALFTKAGLNLVFNDKDKIITLATPGGNKLVLDDKNGQIQLVDQNGNSLQMDKDGVTLKSAKDATVQAAQSLNLKGDKGVAAVSSGGDLTGKGMNVTLTAQTGFTAKGSASAEVQGGSMLTLKGGMVMIN